MDKQHAESHFTTRFFEDRQGGCAGLELVRNSGGQTATVARVTFWDAQGQFALEMSVSELPVVIVEELIAEAKSTIKVR